MMNRLLLSLLACFFVAPSFAATIRVERDGSADFAVIQDAVNAAASGDTIYIGPGRYNEGEIVTTAGWSEFVRVLVHQDRLTLIGAGPDETILGPTEPYVYEDGQPRGIEAGPYFGNNALHVENIGFENMWGGVVGATAPDVVTVNNCSFWGNHLGVACISGGTLEISNCQFEIMREDGFLLFAQSLNQILVSECEFTLAENQYGQQIAVHLQGNQSVDIMDCRFNEGKLALYLVGQGFTDANIRGCQFVGQSFYGLLSSNTILSVDDCFFEQQEIAFYFTNSTNAVIQNTAIMDANTLSLDMRYYCQLEMTNCILAHGSQYTVQQRFCDKGTSQDRSPINMTNNDWGTTDAETIASWIHVCDFEVDYIPFIGQPVATEVINFGGLKAMFR